MVLKVATTRWKQTPDDLRKMALEAEHLRTRERFLALYEITQGSNASRIAERTGRHDQSVMSWVQSYNESGPSALEFERSGGRTTEIKRAPRKKREAPVEAAPKKRK